MLKCRHQCHCACTSEIRTCIINETGRQAAHKKNNENTRVDFGRITPNDVLYSWFEGLDKKKHFHKNYQAYRHYPFKDYTVLVLY